MVPTQWTGRVAALAVDSKHCSVDACKLYIGSAGGGVWMTNNALAERPSWHEKNDGLDSRAIGSITIDPTDATGNTIYVGTGEENGSSDNEAGLGVYKSTDGGNHWSVLPGSVAAAKDRGVGDIAIDPTSPSHIYIGTMVARHGVSSTNGGRFTPPGAPRLGLYESKDGGNTFTLIYSRDQDSVVPGTPTGLDLFRGAISRIQFDPNDPSLFYFTMFNYGAFRAKITPAGTTVTQIFTEPTPNRRGRPASPASGSSSPSRRCRTGRRASTSARARTRSAARRRPSTRRSCGGRTTPRRLRRTPTGRCFRARSTGRPATARTTSAAISARTTCPSPRRPASRTRCGSAA